MKSDSMVDMTPEMMGYDRTIVVFSPDGRLFQVEYAREAVKRAPPAVGVVFKDGVVLGARKREAGLVKPGEKIYKLDDHIATASSGLVADARVLVDTARVRAQQNKLIYDEPVSVGSMAKFIADKQQLYTQYAGVRPYGVSFLIGGVNSEPKLFETDPSGIMLEVKAHAIGKAADKINEFFEKSYKQDMDMKDAVQFAIDGLKKEGKVEADDLTIVVMGKKLDFKELSAEEFKDMKLKV